MGVKGADVFGLGSGFLNDVPSFIDVKLLGLDARA